MIKIGVLEDEVSCFDTLNRFLRKYAEERNVELDIELYTDGMKLLETNFTRYDILFLDIQVPMVNGLQAARRIREKDKNVILIFITNLAQYAICGYEVEAMDYILKPIKYPSICFRMDKAVERVRARKKDSLTLHVGRKNIRIDTSEIYYVEANRHQTIYHTREGKYSVWESFTDAKKKLEGHSFAQCHGSYLCNLKWVTQVTDSEAVIANSDKLKISRNQKQAFMDAVTLYWTEGRS